MQNDDYIDKRVSDDEEYTGVLLKEDNLEDTMQIKTIKEDDILSDTNVDIFGDDNNE